MKVAPTGVDPVTFRFSVMLCAALRGDWMKNKMRILGAQRGSVRGPSASGPAIGYVVSRECAVSARRVPSSIAATGPRSHDLVYFTRMCCCTASTC